MTLIAEQIRNLQDTNATLAKCRKAKKTRLQHRGALSLEDSEALLSSKAKGKRVVPEESENGSIAKRAKTTLRRCSVCGKAGHNARTCSEDVELASESESD